MKKKEIDRKIDLKIENDREYSIDFLSALKTHRRRVLSLRFIRESLRFRADYKA